MVRDFEVPTMIDIEIVRDEDIPCPECGAYWGHPDEDLDYPNRYKIYTEDGDFCRCYNPDCDVEYYSPDAEIVQFQSGERTRYYDL